MTTITAPPVLVVVQLSGGNDFMNTVVPLNDGKYRDYRPNLGIPEEIGVQNRDRDPLLPYQEIDNHVISSKSTLFFDKSSLDITLGYVANNRKEFEDEHHHDRDRIGQPRRSAHRADKLE